MSLAQEPLVCALNRRFYFYFFDAFAANTDPARRGGFQAVEARVEDSRRAIEFWNAAGAKRLGGGTGGGVYAGLFQADGSRLAEVGFGMKDFYAAILETKAQAPAVWELSAEERSIVEHALEDPGGLEASLAAARVYYELLDFERADAVLEAFCEGTTDAAKKVHAQHRQLHYRLARNSIEFYQYDRDLEAGARQAFLEERQGLRDQFLELGDLPPDLEGARILDAVVCDVELRPSGIFFTGFQFVEGANCVRLTALLEGWIERFGEHSPRVGECMFLLGLAHRGTGKPEAADRVWREHVEKYPADRFAALSRMHDSAYQFSPYRGQGLIMTANGGRGVAATEEDLIELMRLLQRVDKTQVKKSDES